MSEVQRRTERRPSENRFDLRIAADDKDIIETAATLSGQTLSAFVKSVALREARSMIDAASRTTLSLRDQKRFVQVVLEGEEPTATLTLAAKRYKSRIKSK